MPTMTVVLLLVSTPVMTVADASQVPDLAAFVTLTSLVDPALEVDATATSAPTAGRYTAGTWEVPVYGSATIGSDPGEIYLAHAGVSYYFRDQISVSLEAVGGTTIGDNTGTATGLDVLWRWHFLQHGRWSLFAEGGAGFLYTSRSFKSKATHFNFSPQVGAGARLQISDTLDLMGGVRWHHISNADIDGRPRNIGFDGPMLYGGAVIAF